MSSNDFEKILVTDPRLCVSDKISYGVHLSGSNVTTQVYKAITSSTSQISYNIQVPSQQTVLDRRVSMRNRWTVRVSGQITQVGNFLVNMSVDTALAPFPCNQNFTTVQATINNNTLTNWGYKSGLKDFASPISCY